MILLAAAAGWANAARAESGTVALTFDDLPALTLVADQAYVNRLNALILRALRRHHMRAIGFVNEGKLDDLDRAQQIEVLRLWLRSGMELGNHTYSHESPESLGVNAYIADIERGEHVTRKLLARRKLRLQWFRHPYLRTGSSLAVKNKIDRWLAAHGYRVAPVTLDCWDWMFAEPYDDAIRRHDRPRQAAIIAEYLAHTGRIIRWHQHAAQILFGRQIPFVILLHATRLNADAFGGLAGTLLANGLRVVTLEQAMRDRAYQTPDRYIGPIGAGWLKRWSIALGKRLPNDGVPPLPPAHILSEYRRLDGDQ